jgi:hypothetical protein
LKNYFIAVVTPLFLFPVYGFSNNLKNDGPTLQFICNELLNRSTSNSITIRNQMKEIANTKRNIFPVIDEKGKLSA